MKTIIPAVLLFLSFVIAAGAQNRPAPSRPAVRPGQAPPQELDENITLSLTGTIFQGNAVDIYKSGDSKLTLLVEKP